MEETRLCNKHAKAVALYSYRLSRRQGVEDEKFVPSMMVNTEVVKSKEDSDLVIQGSSGLIEEDQEGPPAKRTRKRSHQGMSFFLSAMFMLVR